MKKNIPSAKYWIESSEKDFEIAQILFKSKHYPQCLFFCHLSMEKILKAIVVKITKDYPPYTHGLQKLAEIGEIKLDLDRKDILNKISTFNIAGRYAHAKLEFHKKYNKKEYAQKYLEITKNLLLWLKKEFQKK
jgi:HEPN domain-containing protein